jgi:predicted transcriptional regulator
MTISLQNPMLDQKLPLLAEETGRPAESVSEDVLTSYFEAAADVGTMLEERLREVEEGRVVTVDGEAAFARLRE